jgi:hypothetical protein
MEQKNITQSIQEYQNRISALEQELRQVQLQNERLQLQLFNLANKSKLMQTVSTEGWRRYRYLLFPAGSQMERWAKRFYHALKNLGR